MKARKDVIPQDYKDLKQQHPGNAKTDIIGTGINLLRGKAQISSPIL